MSTRSMRREIATYLQDVYGVGSIEYAQNGHGKMKFDYGGIHHTIVLSTSPSCDDHTAISVKQRDIRHLLGDPPTAVAPKTSRKLEEMMPEPILLHQPERKSNNYQVYAGGYHGSAYTYPQLRFFLPQTLVDEFSKIDRLLVSRVDQDTWRVDLGGRSGITKYDKVQGWFTLVAGTDRSLTEGLDYFGKSPAEALLVDGSILIRCPVETRVPILERSPRSKPADSSSSFPVFPTVDEMRACLAEIRRIEAATERRLVKRTSDGAWVWKAETIE